MSHLPEDDLVKIPLKHIIYLSHLSDDDLLEGEEAVYGPAGVGVVRDKLAHFHVGPAARMVEESGHSAVPASNNH